MVDKIDLGRHLSANFNEVGRKQLLALPEATRDSLVFGTREKMVQVVSDIQTRERLQNTELLGEEARRYVEDLRSLSEMSNKPKTSGMTKKVAGIFPALRKK